MTHEIYGKRPFSSFLSACVLLLAVVLLLPGCSRQSVTDFTPYPANQGTVILALHEISPQFITASGVEILLNSVTLGVGQVTPTVATIGQKSAALRAEEHDHDHDHAHEDAAATSTATAAATGGSGENQAGADNRPLVPVVLAVNRPVNLLEETILGSLSLRSGAETGWKLALTPMWLGDATGSLRVTGTVKKGTLESSLTILVPEALTLEFTAHSAVPSGSAQERALKLDANVWFRDLPLDVLVGSGPILIDHDHHEVLHPFVQNVSGSVATATAHVHE
jgi:hypothetical protein